MIRMDQKTVILVGQLPPPIHGQSIAIERIAAIRDDAFEIVTLPLNCSDDIESVGRFQFRKILRIVEVALKLRRMVGVCGQAVVYYPPASPAWIPILRDAIFFAFARGRHRNWVYHFHAGGLPEFLQASRFASIARRIYPRPEVNISMSRDAQPSPGEFFGGRDVYIPYGLEIPIPFTERGHLPHKRLLFVGNLFLSKGVGLCIEAVHRLRRQGHDVTLDLVGGTVEQDRDAIRQKVDQLNVHDSVVFHGVVSGEPKWALFAEADCFVFPSHYPAEKFPNVLIEALGAGLPVVSTRWRGIPELIGDNLKGSHLIEPGDLDGLVEALQDVLISSDADYKSRRRASRDRYESRYTLGKFNASILQVFRQAAS
jgi:glycosyltransferase involved in cell wall biosynthesis